MTQLRLLTLGVPSMLLAGASLAPDASAKPKRLVNGCTAEQIRDTPIGQSCADQMEQDILGNKPYTHALLCNGSDIKCCTYDNKTNQIINCRSRAGASRFQGLQGTLGGITGTVGVQSRGVEGADSVDENEPAPAWMTEERMKQLRKDAQAQ